MVERCLEHKSTSPFDCIENLVGRHFANQHEQRSAARLQVCCEILHEGIIDAKIR
jgi:hypothetical protein